MLSAHTRSFISRHRVMLYLAVWVPLSIALSIAGIGLR